MKENNLSDIATQLNKKFGKDYIIPASDFKALKLERIHTSSLSLDIETGGGIPKGRLIEIYGSEASGKTAIATMVSSNIQKSGGRVLWCDAEGAMDLEWAQKLGMNLNLLDIAKPETGELAGDTIEAAVKSGEYELIVLDSIAALIPALDLDTSMSDPEKIGNRAKMVNRIVRKLHAALNIPIGEDKVGNNTTVIFINQIREKIGIVYGNPEVTPGGLAVKFGASLRIHLRKGKYLKDNDDNIIGQEVRFKTVKNKTAAPGKNGTFNFYFAGEMKGKIDRKAEIITYGIVLGLIKVDARTYYIDEEKIGSKSKLNEYLDDKKVLTKIEKEIKRRIFREDI